MQTQRGCWVWGMIVSLDVFRVEDENRQRGFVIFFSSTAEMIVAWGHGRPLWDPSLEKSIPPLISVFGGAEITALKWRFIRGERVVTVGLSWDKPTAGQVRSASFRTITNTQIGLICWSNLFIWGSMEGRVDAQGYSLLWFIHLPAFCFCFSMGNKFWVFKDAVNSYLNRSWDIFIWTTLKAIFSVFIFINFLHPQIPDFQIIVSRPNLGIS